MNAILLKRFVYTLKAWIWKAFSVSYSDCNIKTGTRIKFNKNLHLGNEFGSLWPFLWRACLWDSTKVLRLWSTRVIHQQNCYFAHILSFPPKYEITLKNMEFDLFMFLCCSCVVENISMGSFWAGKGSRIPVKVESMETIC